MLHRLEEESWYVFPRFTSKAVRGGCLIKAGWRGGGGSVCKVEYLPICFYASKDSVVVLGNVENIAVL